MEISLPYHHSQNVLSGICPVIPACLWRESIPIGVIPDIVYRASILVFFGWIPALTGGDDHGCFFCLRSQSQLFMAVSVQGSLSFYTLSPSLQPTNLFFAHKGGGES
jgi:hypothetical protein